MNYPKVLNKKIQPGMHYSECRAMASLIRRFASDQKGIFIADRGYESYCVCAHIQRKGMHYLIRARDKNKSGIASQLKLPKEETFDMDVELILSTRNTKKVQEQKDLYRFIRLPYRCDFFEPGQSEYPIAFRVVRFPISEDKYESIITNLPRENFPTETIKRLYAMRWGIITIS